MGETTEASGSTSAQPQWRFWIDCAGTFTNIVARDPDGRLHTHKLLSENDEHYRDAATEGIRQILGLASGASIPSERIEAVKMGTTVATNALLDDDIPMNDGCLKPLRLNVPQGCMLNPRYPAAVVAGNVETSQAITDTLYGALGVMAASQGTMNNFTFGDDQHQYYETICAGSGAGPDFDGTHAVHTHMTNSRLTDPEVLEWRFPVLLEDFRIRAGSGGSGRHRGGDMAAGDVFVTETPGGGGYGHFEA